MPDTTAVAVNWIEQGFVPDSVVRLGVRRVLKARLAELHSGDAATTARMTQAFVEDLRQAPIALLAELGNQQQCEVPAVFFGEVLGKHRKFSSCFWGEAGDEEPVRTLDEAEAAALAITCARAQLADGQQVLELGCGWGSLSLWMAERYPASRITALSHSISQRQYIECEAARRGLTNLRIATCDINEFDTAERFDRIVSIEMFEHLRNWPRAFAQVARWLQPEGRFFMQVFAHREAPYTFAEHNPGDWLGRHFCSGGMMPSDDLALHFQDDLSLQQRWRWDGTHYQRTAEAWLLNMDRARDVLMPMFESAYGVEAAVWWMRWRLFLMSVAESFGYAEGQQWWVSHYLFTRRRSC